MLIKQRYCIHRSGSIKSLQNMEVFLFIFKMCIILLHLNMNFVIVFSAKSGEQISTV